MTSEDGAANQVMAGSVDSYFGLGAERNDKKADDDSSFN